jgi:hypothetical protein
MKKLLAALLITLSASSALALDWKNIASIADEEVQTIRYSLEALGYNMRLYEWDCPQNPKNVCWIAIGSSGTSGSGSYPKVK